MVPPEHITRIDPFGVQFDLDQAVMQGATRHTVRRAADMRGYDADPAVLERLIDRENDPLHYEVFEIPVPEEEGHLMYCISKLQAGARRRRVFHEQRDTFIPVWRPPKSTSACAEKA